MKRPPTDRENRRGICVLLLALCLSAGAGYGADAPKGEAMPQIAYRLRTDSKVSIAIYDPQGAIVRQLLLAAPRKAGRNAETWNGLDDKGKTVPPGQYSWKLLSSQGLKAEWMASLGSGLTPGWQIMPGNHVGAVRIARDENVVDAGASDGPPPRGSVGASYYVMGGCAECVPSMAKITRAGKALWHSGDLIESNNDCGVGLANGKLFTLLGNAKVIAIDPATGKGLWRTTTDWNDVKEGWKPGSEIIGLAARGDQLAICHKAKCLVRWLSTADGSKLDETAVPNPQALAIDGAGNTLAISGTSVVKLSLTLPRVSAPREVKTLISGLSAPVRLAADPASGEIFVAEAGEVQQIKRFSADGTLLATYGRKGGRLFGKYDPQDFRGVTDVAADRDGGFVVVEGAAAPRRVAFFDRAGRLLQEWYGGLAYTNGGAGDPDDPSIVWFWSGSGEVVKAKIDFVKKTYHVLETYKLGGIGDGVIPPASGFGTFVVRHFRGRTYLLDMNVEPRIVMVDEANRRLVPLVAAKYFLPHDFMNPGYTPRAFVEAYFGGTIPADPKPEAVKDAANRQAVLWTDLNGDGKPQPEEMVFSARKLMTHACGRIWADQEMNLYEMNDQPMVWRPKGWTKGGAPLYGGWADWQSVGEKPKGFDPIKVSWPAGSGVVPISDGSLLGFFNSVENPFGKGICSDGLGGNFIVKWDRKGKVVWCTGFHSPDFGAAPGEARFFWNIAGVPHDCLAVTDMQCYYTIRNLVHVWDPDGLWVGRLLETPDLQAAPEEAYTLATENFGGTLLEVTRRNRVPGLKTGDVVFYGCGQNVTSVYRVSGWDTFRRDRGSVSLSSGQAEVAKTEAFKAAAIRSSAGRFSRMKKFVASTLPRLATPPVLDGKLDDEAWKKAGVIDDFRLTPAEEDKETLPTTVLAGYDDANLYLAVRCTENALDKLHAFESPMHLGDSVELFVDRHCDRSRYYQIMINPNGAYYVGLGWTGKPEIKIDIKAGREANAWVAEMAIPWKNIDAAAPKDGEKLGFNVVRNRFAADQEWHTNWSPLLGNLNHSPGLFGTLYVGEALPREAVALRDGRAFIHKLGDKPIVLDGSLDPWRGLRPLKIMDGAKPMADIYLGWKTDGLYAAFDVTTDKPWKNAAAFDMAFNGGAACDLQFGPIVKDQKETVPGDVRFLAAPLIAARPAGAGTVPSAPTVARPAGAGTIPSVPAEGVEFLPKLTPDLAEADKAPRAYHTDAQGDSVFERLALLPAGSVAAKAKPDGKGYIVTMRVPLRAPLKLESGQRFRFDASILLSTKDGTRAALRLPWFSMSSDDMFVATDVIIETRLRPWNWGEAELE